MLSSPSSVRDARMKFASMRHKGLTKEAIDHLAAQGLDMQRVAAQIAAADKGELLKELDDLWEEMLEVEECGKEFVRKAETGDVVRMLRLNGVKAANGCLKCLISRKQEFYQKVMKDGKELMAQLLSGVFSESISHAQLCRDAIILVKICLTQ